MLPTLNCRRDITRQFVEKGGDYASALKGNHRARHDDASLLLGDASIGEGREAYNRGRRMVESRPAQLGLHRSSRDPKTSRWPGLAAIGKVIRAPETPQARRRPKPPTTCQRGPVARTPRPGRSHWGSKTGFIGVSTPSCTRAGREIPTITAHAIHMALNLRQPDRSRVQLRSKFNLAASKDISRPRCFRPI